ncbi:MAG: S9 family peptidase [Elusimicrobia bacterium]|nr:S9 family peptidase [Elusimicrobiota bacterium]
MIPVYPARRFFAVRSVGAWAVSPDAREACVATNPTGVPELWQVPVAGGWPIQRTFDGQVIGEVDYSPDGKWIAFLQDEGGTEAYQVCLLPRSGAAEKRVLTTRRDRRHLGLAWSPDSKRLYYCSNRSNPAAFRLYCYDVASGVETELNANERPGDAYAVQATKDGVVWVLGEANLSQRLLVHDFKTGRDRDLTPGAECTVFSPFWAERERRIYFVTNLGSDTHGIGFVSVKDGAFSWRKKPGRYEIQGMAVHPSGRGLAWVENRDGSLAAFLERGGRARRLAPPKSGTLGLTAGLAFVGGGRALGLVHSEPAAPHELFLLDLKKGSWTQLTRSAGAAVPREHLVVPKLVRYKSDDGLEITGFLFLPKRGAKPFPLVVWPHGGPEHQETAEYRARHQYWANRGYAVFAPNFRGSTGRGRAFQKRIYKDWGGGHYRDVTAGVRRLIADGWADPARVALYGASFGGYTALWGITQDPDFWKAAVAAVAPSNLKTLIETTHAAWRKNASALIGDPDTEAQLLRERSPVTFVDRVKTPLMIFQGANDPRVPRAEAEQFVDACRKSGVAVEYVCFENEGHGWRTLERVYEEMGLAEAFLAKHLSPSREAVAS